MEQEREQEQEQEKGRTRAPDPEPKTRGPAVPTSSLRLCVGVYPPWRAASAIERSGGMGAGETRSRSGPPSPSTFGPFDPSSEQEQEQEQEQEVPGRDRQARILFYTRTTQPGWRNWQTRRVEGAVGLTSLAGSTPVPGMRFGPTKDSYPT